MLRVGLIQLSIIEGNVQENKKHIRDLVTKYSRDEIDLLCFPELCLSGYDFDQADNSLDESEFMAGLAKEYSVSILAGIYLRKETSDTMPYVCGTKTELFLEHIEKYTYTLLSADSFLPVPIYVLFLSKAGISEFLYVPISDSLRSHGYWSIVAVIW